MAMGRSNNIPIKCDRFDNQVPGNAQPHDIRNELVDKGPVVVISPKSDDQ